MSAFTGHKRWWLFFCITFLLVAAFIASVWAGSFCGIEEETLKKYFPRLYPLAYGLANYHVFFKAFILIIGIAFYSFFFSFARKLFRARKEVLVLLLSVWLSLLCSEIVLRTIFGFNPGYFARNKFVRQVKELKMLTGYATDSTGVFKADSAAAADVAKTIQEFGGHSLPYDFSLPDTVDGAIYGMIYSSTNLMQCNGETEFEKCYCHIIGMPDSQRNDLQKGIVQFVNEPYNHDGFRSIPFCNYTSGKKKILLLGDSFTWGGVADPPTNSFAELLLARGYTIYNTGIPGTDPEQYREVAKKYIPLLKPDVVIVNLFTGNDVNYFERKLKPFTPAYFATNAGNLNACPKGLYFKDMHEAYAVMLSWYRIPAEDNWFNWCCSQTAVTSVFWSVLYYCGKVKGESFLSREYHEHSLKYKEASPVCQRIVGDIKRMSEESGARFLYLQIPDLTKNGLLLPKDMSGYADTLAYFTPADLTPEDYNDIGGHFNNEGHRKYAALIGHLIDSIYHR